MATKKIEIIYDINGKAIDVAVQSTLNLQQQVKALTAELRKTKEGSDEFKVISSRLSDVKDELSKTTAKSKDLFGSLSMLPGPVGQFFGQLQSGIDLLKTFSSFTFKDLAFQFKETANDIGDIAKNLTNIDTTNIDNLSDSTQQANQNFRDAVSDSAELARTQKIISDKKLNEYETEVAALKNLEAAKKKGNIASQYQIGLIQDEVTKRGLVPGIIKQTTDAEGNLVETTRALTQSELQLSAANKNVTVTTEGMVVAEKAATFWTTTLGTTIKTVLISTGILAAIVIIGELVAMIYRWVTSSEEAENATRSLTEAIKEQQRVLENDLSVIDMANKAAVTRAKIAGKSEKEINEIVKNGGEERLQLLRDYDNQLYNDQEKLNKKLYLSKEEFNKLSKEQQETILNARKLKDEDATKLNNEINEKLLKNGQEITKQILTNEQTRLDQELSLKEKERSKTKEHTDKLLANNKQYQDKLKADNKTADETLLKLLDENAALRQTDKRKREDEELKSAMEAEERTINMLKISEEKKGIILNQIKVKYGLKVLDINAKRVEEDQKTMDEEAQKLIQFNQKKQNILDEGVSNELEKDKSVRKTKYQDDLAELEKDKNFIKLSEDEKGKLRIALLSALNNDLKKIQDDADEKKKQDKLKKLDDDIKFQEISNEANKNNFKEYFNGRQKLLELAKQRELAEVEAGSEKALIIEKKYATLSKDLQKEKFQAILGYTQAGLGAASNVISQAQQVNSMAMSNELDEVKGNAEKEDKIKEKYFYKNKDAQIGQAIISTLQSAISAYSSLAVIPVVGPVLGGIAAAAALVFGYKQVALIKAQKYQSSITGGAGAAGAKPGKNYGDGGMIDGPRHSSGGVPITAEGGEAIMTRGSVTMFKPLLSMMNQMGGGTSFSKGAVGQSSYDNPKTSSTEPQIIKTYVVENELTTNQHRIARLKDLSTL